MDDRFLRAVPDLRIAYPLPAMSAINSAGISDEHALPHGYKRIEIRMPPY
jgi:hypothetical protein